MNNTGINYWDVKLGIESVRSTQVEVLRLKNRSNYRELSLAVTKLEEAEMWLERLAGNLPSDAEGEL